MGRERTHDSSIVLNRQPLEHLLRYCVRLPFALERLFMSRGADSRIVGVRSVLPRHKAGANGVVQLTPFEFLDRLADLEEL